LCRKLFVILLNLGDHRIQDFEAPNRLQLVAQVKGHELDHLLCAIACPFCQFR
jgi:hypothetical protein